MPLANDRAGVPHRPHHRGKGTSTARTVIIQGTDHGIGLQDCQKQTVCEQCCGQLAHVLLLLLYELDSVCLEATVTGTNLYYLSVPGLISIQEHLRNDFRTLTVLSDHLFPSLRSCPSRHSNPASRRLLSSSSNTLLPPPIPPRPSRQCSKTIQLA